ncbi:hypothetical protein DM02DRAFT_673330 [Periconia macrospinosa]|uniref:Uncharacterized protein n=1 Tax=Periconia macrospinosa TaxID=97972 RepID=A0A2V1DK33_9PLEO|nr:hypothetical protein DM02DRAFT_673330 [Periconia macrospinosa]
MRSTILLLAATTASAALVCNEKLTNAPDFSTLPAAQIKDTVEKYTAASKQICSYNLPHMENSYQGSPLIFERWDEAKNAVPSDETQCKDAYNQIFAECALNGKNGGRVEVGDAWYEAWLVEGKTA